MNNYADNRDAFAYPVSDNEIGDIQSYEVATSQLAVDRQIEHHQIPEVASQFEPNPTGPDLRRQQRSCLANQASLVPGHAHRFDGGELDFRHELSSNHPSHSMRRHRVDQLILRKKPNGRFWSVVPIDDAVLPQGSSDSYSDIGVWRSILNQRRIADIWIIDAVQNGNFQVLAELALKTEIHLKLSPGRAAFIRFARSSLITDACWHHHGP